MHRFFHVSVRIKSLFTVAAMLALAVPAARAQVEGGPRDGGAWGAGDFWRFDRRFSLRLDDFVPGASGTLVFNERFSKTVRAPAAVVRDNGLAGSQRVYLRNRSSGSVTGSGVWFLPEDSVSDLVSLSVVFNVLSGDNSSGYDWRRVSDLAEVRETFQINGTLRARITGFTLGGGVFYSDNINATSLLNVTIDNGPALEYADFPLDTIGEVWAMTPTRAIVGQLILEMEDIQIATNLFVQPATTITTPLNTTEQQTFVQTYAATGQNAPLLAGGTFPNTERIDAASPFEGDTLHWSGTAKEFVDHAAGASPVFEPLYGFRTSLTGSTPGSDYLVNPDAALGTISFNPPRPAYGSPFLVSWTGGGTYTLRLRDHSGTESSAIGTSPQALIAPMTDDDSPTGPVNPDLGSYGIEFISGGVPVELATVRVGGPVPSPTASPMASPTAMATSTAAGPPNDHFANRFTLTANITASGTNVNATREAGEPVHAGTFGTSSVWWGYVGQSAPCSPGGQYGTLTARVTGATTLLGVYTGSSVGGLTQVASASAPPGLSASVFFNAQTGVNYKIAVDSVGGQGNVTLFYGGFPSPTPCNTHSPSPSASATPTATPTPTPTAMPTATVTSNCTPVPSPAPIYPFDGATDVPVDTVLTWGNAGCSNFTVRLDVGTSATTVVATNANGAYDPPVDLLPGTTYAWSIFSSNCVSCWGPSYGSGDVVFTTAGAAPTASPPPTPSPTVPPTPTPFCCPGDANNSGSFVDATDFISVQANFGADNGVGGLGDADCSGSFVDAGDFIAVQANFGADCG